MGIGNKIGSAYLEIKATGAQKAKVAINGVTNAAKKMSAGFDKSLGNVATRMEGATEGARKFQGAIGGVLGIVAAVAAGFYKLGNAVFEVKEQLQSGKTKAKEFLDELRSESLRDFSAEADGIRKRIDELNKVLAGRGVGGAANRGLGLMTKRLEDEKDALTAALQSVNRAEQGLRAREQRQRDAEDQNRKAQVEGQTASLEISLLQARASAELDANEQARLLTVAAELQLKKDIADTDRRIADAKKNYRDEEAEALMLQQQLIVANAQATVDLIERNRALASKALAEQLAEEKAAAESAARAKIQADKEAADAAREQARETARVMAEENAKVLADFAAGIQDSIAQINGNNGASSSLEFLLKEIQGDIRRGIKR